MVKMMGLFTFPHFKRDERRGRMGHNTCESMRLVLCVVRRYVSLVLLRNIRESTSYKAAFTCHRSAERLL